MLTIYTSGYAYSHRHCCALVIWFCEKYLPRHKIEIEITHRGLVREGFHGLCSVRDCDWRPRSFLIEIHNRLSKEDYMKTLFHEMQHILQHIRGDLRDKRGIRCWKGIDCSDLDYKEMPWETDAHQRELELYQEYLTEHS